MFGNVKFGNGFNNYNFKVEPLIPNLISHETEEALLKKVPEEKIECMKKTLIRINECLNQSKASTQWNKTQETFGFASIWDENRNCKIFIDLEEFIGEGACKTVTRGVDFQTLEFVVCSRVVGKQFVAITEEEVEIIDMLHSKGTNPYIIEPYKAIIFPAPNELILFAKLYEKGDGTKLKDMPLQQQVKLLFDFAQAILALHQNGLILRDVKLENFYLKVNEEGVLCGVVGDLGSKVKIGKECGFSCKLCAPPESLRWTFATEAYDSFAFGIMLLEVIFPWNFESVVESHSPKQLCYLGLIEEQNAMDQLFIAFKRELSSVWNKEEGIIASNLLKIAEELVKCQPMERMTLDYASEELKKLF